MLSPQALKRKEAVKINEFMENGNYLTSGDLAMWDTARTGHRSYGDCGCYPRRDGMAATGIGLGAGLGGAALIGVLAVAYGLNAASKARLRAAENAAAGNTKAIEIVAGAIGHERVSRETWQNTHAPSLTQYVDVRTGAGATAGANALSTAEAVAALIGANGRGGQVCPQPVALYQPAMPCKCPGSCND